ncbi:MAG: glycosyltransferase family 4 protein, partial [Planctomycetota bacterium]
LVFDRELSLLTIGELSERKGLATALDQLTQWAQQHPDRTIVWNLVGSGPLETMIRACEHPPNLQIVLHGFCDADQLRDHYANNHLMLFPTLCDEWGLVVDESLHSGLPVVGSVHAQSCATLIKNGINGFRYDPEADTSSIASLGNCLKQFIELESNQRMAMRQQSRVSVAERTPETSAKQLTDAIGLAIARRRDRCGNPKSQVEHSSPTESSSSDHEMSAHARTADTRESVAEAVT